MAVQREANSLQSKPYSRASKIKTAMSDRSRESKLAELRAKTDGDLANVIHSELASGIALTTALGRALGLPPLGACFFGSFVSDFGDKAVTFALVAAVLHALPRRTAARFPLALRAMGAT